MKKYTHLFSICMLFFVCVNYADAQEMDSLKVKELYKMSLQELMDIQVVSASKKAQKLTEAPATIYVITADDIKKMSATSIPDLLRSVPGLDVIGANAGLTDVGGRGLNLFENSKLLILVDGQRINDDYIGNTRWTELPVFLDDIKRIEIILGPMSALYGANSFGGMINIITKSIEKEQTLKANICYGEKETQIYNLGYERKFGDFGFRLTAGWEKSEGWGNRDSTKINEDVLLVNGQNAKIKDWYELSKIAFKAEYQLAENAGISLNSGITFGDIAIPDLKTPEVNNYTPVKNVHASLRYHVPVSEKSNLIVTYSTIYSKKNTTGLEATTKSYNGEIQYSVPLGRYNYIATGIFGEYAECDALYTEDKVSDNLYGFYIQDEFRPIEKIIITGGIRYDKYSTLSGVFSPRLTLMWLPIKDHKLCVSAGHAFRKPSFLENYASRELYGGIVYGLQKGNNTEDGEPEIIRSVNIDYSGKISDKILYRGSYFYNYVHHLIIAGTTEPWGTYSWAYGFYNVDGKITINGGEIEIRGIFTNYLQGFANISYQKINNEIEDVINFSIPKIKYNAGLLWDFRKGFSGSAILHYVGEKKSQSSIFHNDEFHFLKIDPYTTIDMKISYNHHMKWGDLEFAVIGLNILDKEHIEHPTYHGDEAYFGLYDDPAQNYSDIEKEHYLNRNPLFDRKILIRLKLIIF